MDLHYFQQHQPSISYTQSSPNTSQFYQKAISYNHLLPTYWNSLIAKHCSSVNHCSTSPNFHFPFSLSKISATFKGDCESISPGYPIFLSFNPGIYESSQIKICSPSIICQRTFSLRKSLPSRKLLQPQDALPPLRALKTYLS